MKKLFFIALIAIAAMACSNGNKENAEIKTPDNFQHYENALMAFDFPPEMAGTDADEDEETFYTSGSGMSLQLRVINDAPDSASVQAYAAKFAEEKRGGGLEVGEPVIKDNIITLRCSGERFGGKENNVFFVVIGQGGKGVRGMFNYMDTISTTAEPYAEPIIHSIKVK